MSIPCRLRQDVRPGFQSLGAGYSKSPRVPGLSFPSSYRDSIFRSIFVVPNNDVFWITSNLRFTAIRFMYSLKLTDTGPRAPITKGTTMTYQQQQSSSSSSFQRLYVILPFKSEGCFARLFDQLSLFYFILVTVLWLQSLYRAFKSSRIFEPLAAYNYVMFS